MFFVHQLLNIMATDYKTQSIGTAHIGQATLQELDQGPLSWKAYNVTLTLAQLIALDPGALATSDIPILPPPPLGKFYRIVSAHVVGTYNTTPTVGGADTQLFYGSVGGVPASAPIGALFLKNLAFPSPLQLISGVAGGAAFTAIDATSVVNQPIVLNYAHATGSPYTAGDASIAIKLWVEIVPVN